MKTGKLDLKKLLSILKEMQESGHEHVILEIKDNSDSQSLIVHPVEDEAFENNKLKKTQKKLGEGKSFDKDMLDKF